MIDPDHPDDDLLEALTARAHAQAAQIRAEAAVEEAQRQRDIAEDARRRASFLARVTRRMAASMDYETTLREVVSAAVPYIADWCLVSLVRPRGGVRIIGFAHHDPEREDAVATFAERYAPAPGSSITKAITTGEPQIVDDLTADQLAALAPDPSVRAILDELGLRHFATWPIPAPDGTPIGALSLIIGHSGRTFSDDDHVVGETVATRAGLHITNARLHTERSEIAQTLQRGLLPRSLPEIEGVEIAMAYLPAGEENIVGGDFLDVVSLGDGRFAAFLGDIAGKGAAAAIITAAVRTTLRVGAMFEADPSANLALLNRVLIADTDQALCTAVMTHCEWDRDALVVRLANAGHPYPLIRRCTGAVENVTAGHNILAGASPDATFAHTTVRLADGDVLLLFTDGVTEAIPLDPCAGERQVRSVLEASLAQSAQHLVDAVTRAAVELQPGAPRDDISALAIKVVRPGRAS